MTLIDIAPVAGTGQQWMGLGVEGQLLLIDSETRESRPVGEVRLIEEPGHEPWRGHDLEHRLHVSDDGRFAAVVNDYGKRGVIVEVATGRVTAELDGGDYCQETVPFSFCFLSGSLAVYRTRWNRLDVSDVAAGRSLTERPEPGHREAHYLDYFHGRLCRSPLGTRVLDDGWVWHPAGAPAVWSVERWLAENVWESEDGATRRMLCWRDWWDCVMCWLDECRVAIGGLGEDDNEIVAGARIFALEGKEWREVKSFAGPGNDWFGSDGTHLYSSDATGLAIWDPLDGTCLGRVDGFMPRHIHPLSHELATIDSSGGLKVWKK